VRANLADRVVRKHFGTNGSIVFGGVFAAHQIGAAIAATGSAIVRDQLGTYNAAWSTAGILCLIATVLAMLVHAPGAACRWRLPRSTVRPPLCASDAR
jgi:hypothetical protein